MKYAKTYFNTKCPSANEFDLYLNSAGQADLIIAFENHLQTCELCSESIEGYKSMHLHTSPKTPVINHSSVIIKWIGYAATLAIFVGSTTLVLKHSQGLKHSQLAQNYNYEQTTPSNKKLLHKSNAEYLYFGKNQVIEVNDQIINLENTSYSEPANLQSEQVIIEVEEVSAENQHIINSIKSTSSIPVYTFSKTKGLKNN